jgi:glycosyltransferase involved in cell wall biosynthesis
MPIHNEEKLLSYSLPSIFRLKPDEVILIFDRCTDSSLGVAEKISKHYNYSSRTRFIELNEPSPEWRNRIAFLRRYGFNLTKNGVILNTDADMVLDEKIVDSLPLVGKNAIGMVLFSFKPYPRTFQSFVRFLVSPFTPIGSGFGGLSAFSKKVWQETEDQESVKKIYRTEDTHLHSAISRKYKTIFVKTNALHLRERESDKLHFLKGVTRWKDKRTPLWEVIIHSFIYLRPLVLSGYLKARSRSHSINIKA